VQSANANDGGELFVSGGTVVGSIAGNGAATLGMSGGIVGGAEVNGTSTFALSGGTLGSISSFNSGSPRSAAAA
jgi:hypothetical protein